MRIKRFEVALLSILLITSLAVSMLVAATAKSIEASPVIVKSIEASPDGGSVTENFFATDDAEVDEGLPDSTSHNTNTVSYYNFWVGYNAEDGPTGGGGGYLRTRAYSKWDLSGIAAVTVDSAILHVYNKYGTSNGETPFSNTYTMTLEACEVSNDDWSEDTITWNNAPSIVGDAISTHFLGSNDTGWHSLDVTSWVREQLVDDAIVSICLKAQVENGDNVVWFYSKDAYPSQPRACLEITYSGVGVEAKVTPYSKYLNAYPGGTLVYTVTVTNKGSITDTFTLGKSDTAGWTLNLSQNSVGPLDYGESAKVALRVTIPSSTAICTEDNITVTATSTENTAVHASDICTGHADNKIIPTDDTYVYAANPTTNYGTNTTMYVGHYGGAAGGPERDFLKFDLNSIPSGTAITSAKLWVYCYSLGTAGLGTTAQCWSASDSIGSEDWTELTATWSNQPSMLALLDVQNVNENGKWYSWDVTDFVSGEFAGDKVVSFALYDPNEQSGTDHSPYFDTKDYGYRDDWPYLELATGVPVPGVNVSISPQLQENSPGGTLTYTVTVKNTGSTSDNYSLTVSDNASPSWSPSISQASIALGAEVPGNVTLSVTIPAGTAGGTRDNIKVRATSQTDNTITNEKSCVAYVTENITVGGVQVTISENSKFGAPGDVINFTVTVTNTGASTNTFTLTATDTNWSPTLSVTSTTLNGGASRTGIRLSITIPSTAADGDSTTITVTAAGTGYENSATCTAAATAQAGGGISPFVYVGAVVVIVVIIAAVIVIKPF